MAESAEKRLKRLAKKSNKKLEKMTKLINKKSDKAIKKRLKDQKKEAKKAAIDAAPGTSSLEKRLNIAGAKARARDAERKERRSKKKADREVKRDLRKSGRAVKRATIESMPGTTMLEKRLNFAGAKARARKADREETKRLKKEGPLQYTPRKIEMPSQEVKNPLRKELKVLETPMSPDELNDLVAKNRARGRKKFEDAFAKARREKGPGQTFMYNGKEYTTNYKEEENKAKHGASLAIMIAPVKGKKMKAVKKAPGGASMKKKNMYADGGKVTDPKKNKKIKDMSDKELLQMLKRQMESEVNAMSVDSLQRGKAELGKRMSSGLKLEDGGKVTDPKKGNKKISEMSDKELADMMKRVQERHSRGDINAFSADSLKRGRKELMRRVSEKAAKMQDGGSLKPVPSDNKGLSKLPKRVRNKMGYMKNGGKVTDPKKKKNGNKRKSILAPEMPIKGQRSTKLPGLETMPFKPGKGKSNEKPLVEPLMKYKKNNKDKKASLKDFLQKAMYGGSMKKAMYGAKMKKAQNGAKLTDPKKKKGLKKTMVPATPPEEYGKRMVDLNPPTSKMARLKRAEKSKVQNKAENERAKRIRIKDKRVKKINATSKRLELRDDRPYSKRPRKDYIPQTVRDRMKAKKAMYGAKMKK